ncbi:hypothetical protein AGABI1DRAFT_110934 [Agaricus bisporus var. burnettii JB137-S8]|uniref:Uncharacterized protein n=1 Tax=Agaricus bisporus var. burnettii (strain JB137-S8 / ATCC MYA-4627 / FGSC 10392) TaxID=597362 RepID=K5Y804_AGABU|nr:uncharacterized protein AGABI1DRAFT_110934 [Agaricus bisporus var. burnettii JB137-S8]EKM84415.1 hypothetical protein AGABI1DRAFT_110934 [Agaricus bisporus var. burnettii JB137-S8]
MPPPAYSLEAERPYQTEDLRQEVTSVINPPSGTGANSQENRYAASSNEAVRQENHSSVPDKIQPKKKRRVWNFAERIMRRPRKNNGPVLEL